MRVAKPRVTVFMLLAFHLDSRPIESSAPEPAYTTNNKIGSIKRQPCFSAGHTKWALLLPGRHWVIIVKGDDPVTTFTFGGIHGQVGTFY